MVSEVVDHVYQPCWMFFDDLMHMLSSDTTVDMIYDNVLDLGIFMSSNCSFEFHIQNVCKKCSNLSDWILGTFTTRDSIIMMTLFKSLVLPRLDYSSQLWSPHLVKH